jgi:hypothetical protein
MIGCAKPGTDAGPPLRPEKSSAHVGAVVDAAPYATEVAAATLPTTTNILSFIRYPSIANRLGSA